MASQQKRSYQGTGFPVGYRVTELGEAQDIFKGTPLGEDQKAKRDAKWSEQFVATRCTECGLESEIDKTEVRPVRVPAAAAASGGGSSRAGYKCPTRGCKGRLMAGDFQVREKCHKKNNNGGVQCLCAKCRQDHITNGRSI